MKTRLPKEWEMDSAPHFFMYKAGGIESSIGQKINDLMEEYEQTCSNAKLKMYFNIYTLLHPEALNKK
jgi:hypothetical protein